MSREGAASESYSLGDSLSEFHSTPSRPFKTGFDFVGRSVFAVYGAARRPLGAIASHR
ncbi:MAG: hypothetical protein JWO30_1643 [Fibrobacteres bacterium]|nr:hypothetical protein [Fibrobacterota bacterium]